VVRIAGVDYMGHFVRARVAVEARVFAQWLLAGSLEAINVLVGIGAG
jgi:hypothetical protein